MAHRCEHLCSTSQLWLPHPALCVVLPECFQGLHVWSGAMGSKSSKLRNVADRDSAPFLGLRPHETLGRCRREIEITLDEIYSTHTTKKAGYVVERDRPRYI